MKTFFLNIEKNGRKKWGGLYIVRLHHWVYLIHTMHVQMFSFSVLFLSAVYSPVYDETAIYRNISFFS